MKKPVPLLLLGVLAAGIPALLRSPASTPVPADAAVAFAAVYRGLADSILANKRTEKAVVAGLLQVERDLALAAFDKAKAGVAAGELRTAAQHIGDFATEGGAVVEPIRNLLLQGGHHHHAQDSGPEALYERGYVVLTKKMKVSLKAEVLPPGFKRITLLTMSLAILSKVFRLGENIVLITAK